MMYQTELSNLRNAQTGRLFVDIVQTCRKNSVYIKSAGGESHEFYDIDEYLYDGEKSENLANEIADKINTLLEAGYEFDKIGFIEKPNGTIGLIALQSSILSKVKKPGIIIRPKKKLITTSIKGKLEEAERVLILNDVATSGQSIFEAAECVWEHQAKAPYALVVIDRQEGGTENLQRKGIELFSLTSIDSINTEKGSEIGISLQTPSPVYKDFISSSTTLAM